MRFLLGLGINDTFYASIPCRFEVDARQIRQDVKPMRVVTEPEKVSAIGEILGLYSFERSTKFCQGGTDRVRVLRVRLDEQIDVLREAGLCMIDNGIPADDQVPNAMGIEGGQKVFVILEHPVPSSSPLGRMQW